VTHVFVYNIVEVNKIVADDLAKQLTSIYKHAIEFSYFCSFLDLPITGEHFKPYPSMVDKFRPKLWLLM